MLETGAGQVIVGYLGNGASMCEMLYSKSHLATTMGFTAVHGLIMGSRVGAIDPGMLLLLMGSHGMNVKALTRCQYQESGLLGDSGISQDMRELLASDRASAADAVDLFCYRTVREIGSLAAAIGGLDALVFTGGIAECASVVRQKSCRQLGWFGLELDQAENSADAVCISAAVLALPANETWTLARHTTPCIESHFAMAGLR